MAIVSTLLLSAALLLHQEAPRPFGFRLVRTPDGSRFLLRKTKGRPLAVWTYVNRMGRATDPLQLEGLSEACLRASLGAKSIREQVARLPVVHLRIELTPQTSSLQATLPSDKILAFAALMKQRRNQPDLSGLPRAVILAHRELRRRYQDRSDLRPLREMALATILRDPVRSVLFPPSAKAAPVQPQAALRFFQAHHLPSQGLTLVEGNFDLALVARGLSHIFNTPSPMAPPIELPEEPLPSASRILRSHRPGNALAALGWRIPPGWSQDELEALALALESAEAPGSEGLTLRVFPSFPGQGRPSLFILEARALGPSTSAEALLRHLRKRIDRVLAEKTGVSLLVEALAAWRARSEAGFLTPERRLARLAHSLLLGTYGPLGSPSKLQAKARSLLRGGGECANLVDPIPEQPKQPDGKETKGLGPEKAKPENKRLEEGK